MRIGWIVVGFLAVGVAAWGSRSLRVRAMDHYVATQTYEDVYYVPPPEWLPVLSLGWKEAAADLLWMRALIYFGDELVHRGQVRHVFDYTEAILHLDPRFKRVYRWVGTTGMYRPVGVEVEDIRRAIEYLERGARLFPDDGELAWDTGASLSFELAPHVQDSAERDRIRARGAEYMQTAARLGAGPDWLVLTNATVLQRLGRTEQAIRHLEEMYATTRDDGTREQIRLQLARLRNEAHAEAFRHAHEDLEARRAREFPYLDTSLYQLVGPRPPIAPHGLLESGFAPAEPEVGGRDRGSPGASVW